MTSKGKLDTKLNISAKIYKSGGSDKDHIVKTLEARLVDPNDNVPLSDILGKKVLPDIITSQKGSRFIQDIYYATSEEEKQQIFEEIKDSWKSLVMNKFANYVIQKIFENGTTHQKEYFASKFIGSMASMSMEDYA